MASLLRLVSFLYVSLSSGTLDRFCPRKELPPGVVVVVPRSRVLLTCSGEVVVNGVRVNFTRNVTLKNDMPQDTASKSLDVGDQNPTKTKAGEGLLSNSTERVPGTKPRENEGPRYKRRPRMVQATDRSGKVEFNQSAEEMDVKVGHDEEEKEESRGNRSTQSSSPWKWNKKPLQIVDKQFMEISFEKSLTLESVEPTDSGRYTCLHRDKEEFSVKLIITDSPEKPTIDCYKKSPSSKIHCEWTPQRPVTPHPVCYLLLNKRTSDFSDFTHFPCSYSIQHSRCWCTLDFNDDDHRTLHMAFLCVKSFAGDASSELLHFTPLEILKPDPPSNVLVQQEEGLQTRIKIAWNLPKSWNQQDNHYLLSYEIKYHPLMASRKNEQNVTILGLRQYIILDAIPGVEYVIQLRAKEEFDGKWSEWTSPVHGRSWTAAVTDVESTTVFDLEELGSGADDETNIVAPDHHPERPPLTVLIIALFALMLVILVICIFRKHKEGFTAKLFGVSAIRQREDSSATQPSAHKPPESQALVTFSPVCSKQHQPTNCEEREETEVGRATQERSTDAMNFNNASYFFLQST